MNGAVVLPVSRRCSEFPTTKQKFYCMRRKEKAVSDCPHGLDLHHIALALQKKGVIVVADWDDSEEFPVGTIVCIGGDGIYKDEHYLLKTLKGWMDPSENMDQQPRKSAFRESYPESSWFLVALRPKVGQLSEPVPKKSA